MYTHLLPAQAGAVASLFNICYLNITLKLILLKFKKTTRDGCNTANTQIYLILCCV
jgi:hypothetical protein